MRRLLLACSIVTAFLGVEAYAAEAGSAANGERLTKYIIGVANLDKAYAFYHALGIENARPDALRQPAVLADGVRKLVDVPPGTKFRNAMLKIPGADFALEMTEFSGMDLHEGRPQVSDPGAALLILTVRDIDKAQAAAKMAGGEVVTAGGAPVGVGPNHTTRAVLVRDPDSFYVEFVQPAMLPATTAPAESNVIAARFGSVVADAEKASEFYRDRFGLESKVNAWTSDANLLKLWGLSKGELRAATVSAPGNPLAWSFFQFKVTSKSSAAKPYMLRIPDPGAPAVGFQVRDLEAGSAAMKATGGAVITTGDGVMRNPNGGVAFTRDPNGILVELAQTSKK